LLDRTHTLEHCELFLSPARAAIFVVVAATCARLAFAATTGLGIDESYMVAASHRFSFYYFDHPPVAWWLELAARRITGSAAPIVVRLPFVACGAISSWLLFRLTRRLFDDRAAFWAVAAYTISPVFSLAFCSWVLPDGPLNVALLAAGLCLAGALDLGSAPRSAMPRAFAFLLAGLFAGIALDAKYNAGLTMIGALAAILLDRKGRQALATPFPWLAGILALLVFAPIVASNAAHHFRSFAFQGDRALGHRFHPLAPFTIWGGEALFVLPWLWLPMVVLGIRAFRREAWREERFLAVIAAPPVLAFALIGLWSSQRILYHWAAPGYLFLFPLLGAWVTGLEGRALVALRRVTRVSATLLGLAAALIAAETGFGVIPGFNTVFAKGRSPVLQGADWTSLRDALPATPYAIATMRWYTAGKIAYALGARRPVFVLGNDPREFGQSAPAQSFLGQDVLVLLPEGNPASLASCFASWKALPPVPPLIHGDRLMTIPAYFGTKLERLPPTC
jgi:4-amino-4-deoxy-L-arabinose transferase-like glycosyltransferase